MHRPEYNSYVHEQDINNSIVCSELERRRSHLAGSARAGFSSAISNVVRLCVLKRTDGQLQLSYDYIGC